MTNNNNKYSPELRFPEFQNSKKWEIEVIKNICDICTGKSNTQDQVKDGEYPFFIRSKVPVKSKKYLFDCEAVITIGDGKIGQVYHYVTGKFDLHQRCYKMSNFRKVMGKYFYYYFSSHFYERAMKMTAKATVDSVRLEMIADMPFLLPSFLEQKKIADCLSSLDIYLDTTKRKLELLKEYKKGLMQQLFPRNGKNVPELRLPEFQNAPVWVYQALGSIGDTYGGLSGKSAEDFGKGKPYVTYKQVFTSIEIDFSNCSLVQIAQNEKQNKLQYGDILVTISSETPEEIGYTALVTTKKIPECYLNSFCFIFRLFDKRKIDINFMIYLLSSDVYRKNVVRIAQGITRFNISKTRYKEIELPIPSSKVEQRKIAKLLSSIDQQLTHYEEKIRSLELHKKGLTQRLFPKI